MAALQRRFHHWVGWGDHNVDILLAVAYCSGFMRIHSVHCCKCVCKGAHTYVHTYMHIFAHARAHTDRHTHSYTHTRRQSQTDRHAHSHMQTKISRVNCNLHCIYIIMYTIHRTIYVLERNSYDCPYLAILCNVMPCVCVCASIYVWVYIRIYVYAYMKQSMSVALCCH